MSRKFCLALPTGDRCSNYSGAETIPNIVLHDKHRSNASLFRPNYGTQVRIINLSSFYCHAPSRSDIWCSAAASADRNSFPKRTGFNQSHIGRPDATGRIVLENAPLWCTIILWDWCEDGQKKQEEDLLFFCQTTLLLFTKRCPPHWKNKREQTGSKPVRSLCAGHFFIEKQWNFFH